MCIKNERLFCLLASLVAWLIADVGAAHAAPSLPEMAWNNPLVPQRADPHVLLHTDGYYYLAATVPEYNRIEIRRAKTLAELNSAEPKVVLREAPASQSRGPLWAPELHWFDGKWRIYYTAGPWERIRMYVMENASKNPLEGEWKELGQFKTQWDSFSLDATTFVHKGVRYYVWAQEEPGKLGTNIMIARMDTPTSVTGKQVILSRPDLPWEVRGGVWVNEGPAVLVRNGKVFITYSASATDANYCMGLLTADAGADLLDPKSWAKTQEPVFKSTPETSQYGPGHNSFTTTPDGKTVIMVYHSRGYEEIPGGNPLANPDRATRAQILRWKPDGMPDFGVPVADGPQP